MVITIFGDCHNHWRLSRKFGNCLENYGAHHQRLPCVHRESAACTEGLQCPQRVCGVHRGSAACTEGLQRAQRVCSVHRGSAACTEGLQRSQRVCSVHRGSAASTEGLQCPQRVCSVHRGSGTTTCPSASHQGCQEVLWMDMASLGWTWLLRMDNLR